MEHLVWGLPVLLVTGVFQPTLAAIFGTTTLVGRELYKYGYNTRQGPNSNIREAGAIMLNASEILLLLLMGTMWFRLKF